MASAFNPGDCLLFKRGETWRTGENYTTFQVPSNGSVAAPIVVGAYGTGAKPKFLGSWNFIGAGEWRDRGANIWRTVQNIWEDVGNIIFNGESSVGVKRASLVTCVAQGDFYYDPAANRVYMYSVGNPGTFYRAIEMAFEGRIISASNCAYQTFQNLDLRYSGAHGFHVQNSTGIIIEDCDVSWCGGSWHNEPGYKYGNGIELWSGGTDIIVRRNRVWECFDAGITTQGGDETNLKNNQQFVYNCVWNCEYGFEWYKAGTPIDDRIIVDHNVFYNCGGGWGHTQRLDPTGRGIILWSNTGFPTNSLLKNNIIHTPAESYICTRNTENFDYWVADYNCYYNGAASPFRVIDTYYTFDAWRALLGQDAHSSISDPLLRIYSTQQMVLHYLMSILL
jgi:hypothetical protein